jgi:hypothetical protein
VYENVFPWLLFQHSTQKAEDMCDVVSLQRRCKEHMSQVKEMKAHEAQIPALRESNATAIATLKAGHPLVLSQITENHEKEVEWLRQRQKAQADQFVREIEAVRGQRVKKRAFHREKDRIAVLQWLDDSDEEWAPVGESEDLIRAIREGQQPQLFQMKSGPDRVITDVQLSLQHARAESDRWLCASRTDLDHKQRA